MKSSPTIIAQRFLMLLAILLLCEANSLYAQTTWTGSLGADWNTGGNWSAGVPDATDDVTIPNVTNDPLISIAGAVAKSVTVQAGGLLTINAAGTLTINGALTQGFLNQGTVQNSGIIIIGNISSIGTDGIRNEGTINNTGGQINIDRGSDNALLNAAGGINNSGTITIGANANAGGYGLRNFHGNFNNQPGGIVNIDRISGQGLRMQEATFTNQGTVNIGLLNTGVTANVAIVTSILGPFDNQAGGQVNIDRAVYGLYLFSNSFTNAGTVTIGAAGGVSNLMHPQSGSQFINNPGGVFKATGTLQSAFFVNSGGILSPGYSPGILNFNAGEDFSNSMMSIEVNGKTTAGVDYDRINVSGTATLGGTLALTINFNSAVNGDQVTILTAPAVSGEFSSVTGLPAKWQVNYTPTSVILSYGPLPGVNEWTGNVSTNWNDASNWTGGIPDAGDDVNIPNKTNDPVISTGSAKAKSVTVLTGTVLTVSVTGALTVNGGTRGIWNKGSIQNNGLIRIGNTSAVGGYGLYNEGAFTNYPASEVDVDRATTAGIGLIANTFSNSGTVIIGALVPTSTLMLGVGGNFVNETEGALNGTGSLPGDNFTNAGGTLSPGYSPGKMSFTSSENFTDVFLAIEINGTGVGGTNFDQVAVEGTATLGGTLALTINYSATVGDQIVIVTASAIAGTFSHVQGLPAKWNVVYYPTTVVLSYGIPQSTWTGNVNTDWNTAGNWTAGVPDEASDVTIPNTTNDPIISVPGAVAKSITVQNSGMLTLNAAGTLTINGSDATGLLNQGTVQNSGTITIGNILSIGTDGIRNEGTINNTGGQINIDRGSDNALLNAAGGINNSGTITIGANANAGGYGLRNFHGNFNNQPGGIVNIDRISGQGLRMQEATFTNQGTVNIGLLNTGVTANVAIVTSILGPFDNQAGGQVNIDRAVYGLYLFSNSFTNAGTVTIGAAGGVSNLMHPQGTNLFINNPGGVFKATGTLLSAFFVNAGGILSPGYSPGTLNFNAGEDFSNSTMSIEVNGKTTAGVDYDRINVSGTATLGGTLALTINFNSAVNGDQVTILNATVISGTFAAVTGLPANWQVTYSASSVVLSYDNRNYWTGAVSTDWNTPGNWSTGILPIGSTNVIIPDVANDPVLSAKATGANSVHILPGASFTINPGGTLSIHGFYNFGGIQAGLYNQGTVTEKGVLTLIH
jgi:hypothetical protein